MTLIDFIIVLAAVAIIAFVAHYIITTFFPEPVKTPALLVVGIILLIILVAYFLPGAAQYRIWR